MHIYQRPIYLLSDGCHSTEDLYFWKTAAPLLRHRLQARIKKIDCRRRLPNDDVTPSNSVVVICRSLPDSWIAWLQKFPPRKVVYIVDDHFEAGINDPALPKSYQEKLGRVDERSRKLVAIADHVVVASRHLLGLYDAFAPALLLPALPSKLLRATPTLNIKIKLAYHGTRVHQQDFSSIAPAVRDVLDERQSCFYSLLGRHTPDMLRAHSAVKLRGPYKWGVYKRLRPFMKADIGLAPLLDTPFNNAKSWIKFLDITALGAVGIYSNRAPYTDVIEDGKTGLLAEDDPAHWRECMLRLIDDPVARQTMALSAQEQAKSIANPEKHFEFWRDLLQSS